VALTPNSNATAYAAPADLFARYDPRVIADLCGDLGSRVGGSPNPNLTTLAANTAITTALSVASGWVEAACLKGERYGTADLAAANGNSQALLVQLVCDLAMGELWKHKHLRHPAEAWYGEAKGLLLALAEGELIFAFLEAEQAGLAVDDRETSQDVDARYLTTRQAYRLYGRRANRNPLYPNSTPQD
jgi:phage gp36-like protein